MYLNYPEHYNEQDLRGYVKNVESLVSSLPRYRVIVSFGSF